MLTVLVGMGWLVCLGMGVLLLRQVPAADLVPLCRVLFGL